jgi:hypothetical protein
LQSLAASRLAIRRCAPFVGEGAFFPDPHETEDVVQARIRAKIASGQASPGDRFVIFFWRDPGGDE